jgi:hypothetical protein
MVHLVERLLQLKISKVEPMVAEQIKPLQERYVAVFKQQSSAYEYLIDRYNLPVSKPLLAIGSSESQSQMQPSPENQIEPLSQFERRIRTIEKEKLLKNQRKRDRLLSEIKEPKSELALKAIEQVNQIRQKRL